MNGRPKVVVFDLDGTLTQHDTYVAYLFGYLRRHPRRFWRAFHLPLAFLVHKSGLRDNAWLKEAFLKAILGGVDRTSIESWSRRFTEDLLRSGLRPGALASLEQHRLEGSRRILATASLDIYVEDVGAALGFDHVICTRAAWRDDDRLAGHLAERNCYGKEKLKKIRQWLEEHNEPYVDIAYSDHHTDLPLLLFAKSGVAVNSTKSFRASARTNRLKVVDWGRAE